MLMAEFLTAQDIIRCNPCWNSIKSVTIYIFQYIWEIHLILSMFREQIYTSKEDCCFKCNIIVFTTPSEYKYFGINSDFFFKCEQLLICSLRFWFINFFYKKKRQIDPAVDNDRDNVDVFMDIVLRSCWAPQTVSQICDQSHPNQGPWWLYKVPPVCGHEGVHYHVSRPLRGQWEVHEVCPRGISVRHLWVDIL